MRTTSLRRVITADQHFAPIRPITTQRGSSSVLAGISSRSRSSHNSRRGVCVQAMVRTLIHGRSALHPSGTGSEPSRYAMCRRTRCGPLDVETRDSRHAEVISQTADHRASSSEDCSGRSTTEAPCQRSRMSNAHSTTASSAQRPRAKSRRRSANANLSFIAFSISLGLLTDGRSAAGEAGSRPLC